GRVPEAREREPPAGVVVERVPLELRIAGTSLESVGRPNRARPIAVVLEQIAVDQRLVQGPGSRVHARAGVVPELVIFDERRLQAHAYVPIAVDEPPVIDAVVQAVVPELE